MRTEFKKVVNDIDTFKSKLIEWAYPNEEMIWFESNKHQSKYSSFDAALFWGSEEKISLSDNAFNQLSKQIEQTKDYWCGYLSYDLKNELESLDSKHKDETEFENLCFFRPQKILFIKDNTVHFCYLNNLKDEIDKDFQEISSYISTNSEQNYESINIVAQMDKQEYLKRSKAILNHIHKGELYEVNFCQNFSAHSTSFNSLNSFRKLNSISEAPFACLLKIGHHHMISSSPERYLKKMGKQIISQPIKGTAKREKTQSEDIKLKKSLQNNHKERAENIMIVDLVRNDLSKWAKKGSVKVEELCEIYSFKQVHQMVSTISATSEHKNPVDIIKDSFPMGSMTGAPKVAAMEIIETYENTKRGLYSGAVGYFTPEQDFDFNVVIRSILYNNKLNKLSFSVGSAITAKANPESEYNECMLKAKALFEVLGNENA